ncbi:MAG TPA: hypothetical protein VGY32_11465 [Solirubrobacteraceae bacterium]|jgi:hypothetical protein|nr:hypothetical protein [Solirubrobacteraceae bacterium]
MRTADQPVVMQDFARVSTPGGFTGPRGKYDPNYPGLKEHQAAGVPPVLAPYEPYKQIPKDSGIPPVPHQVERYGDVSAGVNTGRLLDRSAGFPWHTLQIDNYSRIWLYVPAANRYIPPFVFGIQFPIFPASTKVEIDAAAPPNFTQPAAGAGDIFSVTCYEAMMEYSPGLPVQSQGGAPSGAVTGMLVIGADTAQDGDANPTDAIDTIDFNMVFNTITGNTWDRMREVGIANGIAASGSGIVGTGVYVIGGGNSYSPLGGASFSADGSSGAQMLGAAAWAFNGAAFDRTRNASAANQVLAPVKGVQLVTGPGGFAVQNQPAANTQATVTQAAGAAGVRHVCTSISAAITAGASAGTVVFVNLRDGASGAGTILWSIALDAPANGSDTVTISGLNIVGTAATAMTLEFSAAGGITTNETVALTGYDVV